MDPERVRAYLQVACAGLGFDIGEIWWTSNEHGSSTLASIDVKNRGVHHPLGPGGSPPSPSASSSSSSSPRFVQLYTSKSFEEKRSMLVNPPDEVKSSSATATATNTSTTTAVVPVNGSNSFGAASANEEQKESNEQHVLSPLLVDAISKTAQVVWANTEKQEGLLGRSDMLLQTAVGMPVAVDAQGNMCVVVMFSPRNIQSSDDAVDYLKSISHSALSSKIPSMKPAFDPSAGLLVPHHVNDDVDTVIPLLASSSITDGVTAQFVSLEDDEDRHPHSHPSYDHSANPTANESKSSRDLLSAPKDCFGIPMLPVFSELEGTGTTEQQQPQVGASTISDAFDEASYGVWSTIMETPEAALTLPELNPLDHTTTSIINNNNNITMMNTSTTTTTTLTTFTQNSNNDPQISKQRKDRMEEFTTAFLDVSVFDLAEVWEPTTNNNDTDYLHHVMSITSSTSITNPELEKFRSQSSSTTIKHWNGAIGRAFSSGNPVWSTNKAAFADSGRSHLFDQSQIQTTLAVPVFSGKSVTPSFVFCCYSFVKTGSVPFVLRFVQQALRLLMTGLDQIKPHQSVGQELWQNVAPADLGEMAADVEMQQHFMKKKRPHESISATDTTIYTGKVDGSPPLAPSPPPPQNNLMHHIGNAIQSVAYAQPFTQSPQVEYPNNNNNNKRMHMMTENHHQNTQQQQQQYEPNSVTTVKNNNTTNIRSSSSQMSMINPLPAPRPLMMPPNPIIASPMIRQTYQQPVQPQQTYQQQQQQQQQQTYQPVQQQQQQQSNTSTYEPDYVMTNIHAPPITIVQQQYQNNATIEEILPEPTPFRTTNDTTQQQTSNNIVQPANAQQQISFAENGMQFCMPIVESTVVASETPVATMTVTSKICRIQGCDEASAPRRPYCVKHSGNRMCEKEGCGKCAQGSTRFCIAHGGGRRCTFKGCDKGARDKFFCAAHGGGKRCKHPSGCTKSAVGGSNLCTAHGGGRRCTVAGCDKSAQSSTKFCVKHGGGKKCCFAGCTKVARGKTQFCAAHGGGLRCKLAGCNRVAIGKRQLCRAHGGGSSRPKKATNGSRNSASNGNSNGRSANITLNNPFTIAVPQQAQYLQTQQPQQQQQQPMSPVNGGMMWNMNPNSAQI